MHFTVEVNPNSSALGHIYYNAPTQDEIENAQHIIADYCRNRLNEIYGKNTFSDRLENELSLMSQTNSAFQYLVLKEIADLSKENNSPMFCANTGSTIEYLIGASPVNPMPPHYHCPLCHHAEENAEVNDGYDLPVKLCPSCGTEMKRDGHNCSEYLYWSNQHQETTRHHIFIHVSNVVFEEMQKRLDRQLSTTASDDSLYCMIAVRNNKSCEELRQHSDKTGIHIPNINISLDGSFYSSIRTDSYKHSSFTEEKDCENLQSPAFLVLKDEIYSLLTDHGYPCEKAAFLAHRISWHNDDALSEIPEDIRGNMATMVNVWSKGSCINNVLMDYYLSWYKSVEPDMSTTEK